ncbi:MAG: prolyl oligopeptidase family serine peptidase [Pseudomonadota bacterium]
MKDRLPSVKTVLIAILAVLGLSAAAAMPPEAPTEDSLIWLEETESGRSIEWVKAANENTLARLTADPRYDEVKQHALEILDRPNRLPDLLSTRQYRGYIYHILQDGDRPRGLLRRSTLSSYAAGVPEWENMVDFAEVGRADGREWFGTLAQASFAPSGNRMLIAMSDGGTDAVTLREFDLEANKLVADGFVTAAGRQVALWINDDTIGISAILSPDDASFAGFPTKVRIWQRGQPVEASEVIYTAPADHIMVQPIVFESATWRATGFLSVGAGFKADTFVLNDEDRPILLDLPGQFDLSAFGGFTGIGTEMLAIVGDGWTIDGETVTSKTVVAFDVTRLLDQSVAQNEAIRPVYTLAEDETFNIFSNLTATRDVVYANILKDVASSLRKIERGADGQWTIEAIEGVPQPGSIWFPSTSDPYSETLVFRYEDFLTPLTEYRMEQNKPVVIRREVSSTDLSRFVTEQFFATAEDGTRVPYFVTRSKDFAFDGNAPVLMYAYGGFGYTVTPTFEIAYSGPLHELWLDAGGVYVSAGPRGGGEYGDRWHTSARGQDRQIVYDDLYAIADDISDRGLGSPGRLGIIGGSNGGLTAAVLATQRPDLFSASIAVVPVIDMMRYHKLLAGAAWIEEYGNPDVAADREVLLSYSPYHNIDREADYPEMLVMTSTQDDRVHPGHARKFAAKLAEQGHPVLFYEARQGGHSMAVDNEGRSVNAAIMATYLMQKLQVEPESGN